MNEITAPRDRNIDVINTLGNKTTQLNAMLCMIYGDGFKNFSNMSDDIQQNYLWACASLSQEIENLSDQL